MLRHLAAAEILACAPLHAEPTTPDTIAKEVLAPLLDPAKVAILKGDRPANARLYKVQFWIETARRAGGKPQEVIDAAQKADKDAILWSWKKLDDFGCFNAQGMAELRKGGSPTITKGDNAGDGIALDHVLPRAVVPELAARF